MNASAAHPRDRLINTAATLVHQQGWTATGINQILSEAGIPKGSFYYYFRSKEALGVAVIQLHYANIKMLLDRTLGNQGLSPDTAIYELLKELTSKNFEMPYKYGCPATALASEVATQSPALLAEANRCISLYETAWAQLISRGQKEGLISPTIDPVEFAKIATTAMQGGFLGVRRTSTPESLELAFASVYQTLFGKSIVGLHARGADVSKLHALAS